MEELELPELILMEDFGGNFDVYNQAVYDVFQQDFIKSRPTFNGTKLRLKSTHMLMVKNIPTTILRIVRY